MTPEGANILQRLRAQSDARWARCQEAAERNDFRGAMRELSGIAADVSTAVTLLQGQSMIEGSLAGEIMKGLLGRR